MADAWTVVWAPEIIPPWALPKVTGRPINTPRFASGMAAPAELVRKLAVKVVEPPSGIAGGVAYWVNFNQVGTLAPDRSEAFGPVFLAHQLYK